MAGPEARSLLPPLSGTCEHTIWVGHAPSPDLGELFPAVSRLSSGPVEALASVFAPRCNWAHLSSSSFPYLISLGSTVLWGPKEYQMPIG